MSDDHHSREASLSILVLDRHEPRLNCHRYYVLSVCETLYGPALLREWGRIGSPGRKRTDWHGSIAEAGEALTDWLNRKRRRGYVLRH